MDLIELHIIQSFPVSCLNRDDLGSPKSAIFGGARRARISSQCLKRAQRQLFRELAPEFTKGERTKLIASAIAERLRQEKELSPEDIAEFSCKLAGAWGKLDDKRKSGDDLPKSATLAYLSPAEIDSMVSAVLPLLRDNPSAKPEVINKAAKKAMKNASRKDAADIALFGRMVADDSSLNVEGAALFSHALSCHKAEPEIDFYTALDDRQPKEVAGAGMAGVLEFNSACYYRYVGINLNLLEQNLPDIDDAEFRTILSAFLRSALLAIPSARKNSMNASCVPSYVLGIKRCGHPLQMANAFEQPVKSSAGYVKESREALAKELERMKNTWGITTELEVTIPDVNLATFISTLAEAWSRR